MGSIESQQLDIISQIAADRLEDTAFVLKEVIENDPDTNDEIKSWVKDFEIKCIYVPSGSTERRGNVVIITEKAKILVGLDQEGLIKSTHRIRIVEKKTRELLEPPEFNVAGKPTVGNILIQIDLEEVS